MNIICQLCEVRYRTSEQGIYVIEYMGKWQNAKPYKIWHADLMGCPVCEKKVISGFGHNPIAEHYEPHFDDIYDEIMGVNGSRRTVYHWYEE